MNPDYKPSPEVVKFAKWLKKQPKSEHAALLRQWMSGGLSDEDLMSDRAGELLDRIDALEIRNNGGISDGNDDE